ncbi:alkaline-phosphatase-like protein [Ilyonectria robusta]|uniref:alkaline-phosphatase-like protein n=1 Tax=Ilyonectria robusta TaxID=1079257 RepID=UPI001E8EE019|nr:alkaline-phosphatase-like protein [Ilyonectria robusta]KAH8680353.1 alkaline-phosphatase-like protein [Ilyonectria robusta]
MSSLPVCFLFSAFFVSVVLSKFVHLCTYVSTIPTGAFLLYLPTFFIADFLVICIARLFLRPVKGLPSLVGAVIGSFITILSIVGASSQLAFYIKTGGELEWHEAKTYATTTDGIKVLLTGGWAVLASGCLILAVAWFAQNAVFKAVGDFLMGMYLQVLSVLRFIIKLRHGRPKRKADIETETDVIDPFVDTDSSSNYNHSESHRLIRDGEKTFTNETKASGRMVRMLSWIFKAATLAFLTTTMILRPHYPFDHMSITLPVSFFDIFKSEPDHCVEQRRIMKNLWPFPHLIDSSNWQNAQGDFKGWAPGHKSEMRDRYRQRTPDWLPDMLPRGFFRWDPKRFESFSSVQESWKRQCPNLRIREPFYNPVNDPLKITNLDTDVLEPLREAFDSESVKIKNVVFILMESLREELFPLRQGSEMHKMILKANPEADRELINSRLAHLTPHLEKISGISGKFTDANGSSYDAPELKWNDQARPGFGGINVVGGFTSATMSTKSFAANHCGAWPMPVEKFEESETDSYQPCIPQVLGMFNEVKENASSESADFRDWPWYPALFESMTEQYDRQERFDQKIGFKHIIARAELKHDPKYNESDPVYKPVNYFGFAEPVVKPYIRDYITNATANNQRIFMSHFTSTTHHAWDTPEWFNTTDYLRTGGTSKWHTDFNKYLNTIRFHDAWMAELLQLFDDLGISDETLVVFAGDHGQTFQEDYHKTGTYEVGHISDFRVPITFRHPKLPRVQYEANATTISVLPTILDLLITSNSLNDRDSDIASDLVNDYEGQSLIRPYKTSDKGRRAWNFAVINSGAGMLAVTSADVPWRLVMPLGKVFEYTFTDVRNDPLEKNPIPAWSLDVLEEAVRRKHGKEAAQWVREAPAVGQWWSLERQRLWKYHL